jgi:nucleoside-diphosphate-sugar epimerase
VAGKTLIVGCGYIGLPLALELKARGHEITAWVRSAETAAGLAPHRFSRINTGSVGDANAWADVDAPCDMVIHCASSGRGGETAYAEVYREGMQQVVERLPTARKVFVSSTSVYGQTSGEIVTEESSAEPLSATGKILREAETIALQAQAMVVRSSGIYGPSRAALWEKFRRGEAVIEGDGSRWINQIHQRDLVMALLHLIDHGDAPVMQRDYYAWCAEFLKKPLPPSGPAEPNRKRGLTNKRVSNAKLRVAGWAPIYPSFREGIAADHSPK